MGMLAGFSACFLLHPLVPFGGYGRELLNECHQVPYPPIIVSRTERRHSCHADAIFHDPEKLRAFPTLLCLVQLRGLRVQALANFAALLAGSAMTKHAHGIEVLKPEPNFFIGKP